MITEHFARRIALLEKSEFLDGWSRQDLQDLTRDVLRFVDRRLRFGSLEELLKAGSRLDMDALSKAVQLFKRVDPARFIVSEKFGNTRPEPVIARLEELVTGLERSEELEEAETLLRLELVGDMGFDRLLDTIEDVELVAADLEALLLTKVALLTDDQVMQLWANVVAESDRTLEHGIQRDPGIAPDSFYAAASIPDARQKLVRYRVSVRPRLVQAMVLNGVTQLPVLGVGIARMLAWTDTASTRAPSNEETRALRCLARIGVCAEKVHGWDTDLLAAAARVPADGVILRGRLFHETSRISKLGTTNVQRTILEQLEHLLQIAEELNAEPSPINNALRCFKLGLEVAAPDVRDELAAKNELALQRLLSRFLVEREVPAFGTKFGWSEVDIQMMQDPYTALVLEVKRLATAPGPAQVQRWASQLLSYMDQAPIQYRGALVLFNLSDVTITAPPVFMRDRVLVVAVNLCSVSPSKRTACIEIEQPPAESDALVVVRRTNNPGIDPRSKRQRKRKSRPPHRKAMSRRGGDRRAPKKVRDGAGRK